MSYYEAIIMKIISDWKKIIIMLKLEKSIEPHNDGHYLENNRFRRP